MKTGGAMRGHMAEVIAKIEREQKSGLDVTGNVSTNSTPLQLWSCTGAANQKWTVS